MAEELANVGEEVTASIIKRGETCVEVNFQRCGRGVKVRAKAHPTVEEFMRNLGSGEQIDVRNLGRHWNPLKKDQVLMAYDLKELTSTLSVSSRDENYIRLDRPGWPFFDNGDQRIFNMSFLRLVGLSEGPGVNFIVRGVFDEQAVRQMGERVQAASAWFYSKYLKPINLTVTVSTQEM
jgi:hypothetical protein